MDRRLRDGTITLGAGIGGVESFVGLESTCRSLGRTRFYL